MKKYYVIQEMVSTYEDGKPLYWYGYYTDKQWTDKIAEARFLDEDLEDVEQRLKEESFANGIYQIITIYK